MDIRLEESFIIISYKLLTAKNDNAGIINIFIVK